MYVPAWKPRVVLSIGVSWAKVNWVWLHSEAIVVIPWLTSCSQSSGGQTLEHLPDNLKTKHCFHLTKMQNLPFAIWRKKLPKRILGLYPEEIRHAQLQKTPKFFRQIAKDSSSVLSLNEFSTSSSTKSAILLRRRLKRKQNMIIYKCTLWNCA